MNEYLIYKHTSPSGKSYIGQTKNLDRRNTYHKSSRSRCVNFYNAIKKYGWESFVTEILADHLTIDEANILEQRYIVNYNTLAPNGYNLTTGGNNKVVSDITRQRLADARSRESDEVKHRRREQMKKFREMETEESRLSRQEKSRVAKQTVEYSEEFRNHIRNIRTGIQRTDDTKQKISQNSARKGKPAYNRGIPHSVERKEKLKQARRSRPKKDPAPIVICPHCGKAGHQGNMMNRWHFDNCKQLSVNFSNINI